LNVRGFALPSWRRHIPWALAQAAQELPLIDDFSASTVGTDVEYVEILGLPGTDQSSNSIFESEGDTAGPCVIDEVIAVRTTDASGLRRLACLRPGTRITHSGRRQQLGAKRLRSRRPGGIAPAQAVTRNA
jgi:hypothetical protein